jgi:hypothetical protein
MKPIVQAHTGWAEFHRNNMRRSNPCEKVLNVRHFILCPAGNCATYTSRNVKILKAWIRNEHLQPEFQSEHNKLDAESCC